LTRPWINDSAIDYMVWTSWPSMAISWGDNDLSSDRYNKLTPV
jgi:hypothetical protein